MKLVESFLTKTPCYKAGRQINVEGLVLYTVATPQPSAKVFVNNWNQPKNSRACVHAFVDANDGNVYQTLPWNHRGWHGESATNDTCIGVNLCESAGIKYDNRKEIRILDKEAAVKAAKRTIESAVELFAQLCIMFGLDPIKDIHFGKEEHNPEQLWNALDLHYSADGFRKDVAACVSRIMPPPVPEEVVEEYAEKFAAIPEVLEVPKPKIVAEVTVPNLRIRTGPGTDCPTTGEYTGRGVFELEEIQNGSGAATQWGKLANGKGWIALIPDYVVVREV